MADLINKLSLYLHLARVARQQMRMSDRDRLLVLAAVVAENLDMPEVAGFCRQTVLSNNPGHMLRHYEDVDEAIHDDEFLYFLKQLRRRYPVEKAETMLQEAGIDRSNERDAYFSDEEYAASLLGVDLDWLKENFSA